MRIKKTPTTPISSSRNDGSCSYLESYKFSFSLQTNSKKPKQSKMILKMNRYAYIKKDFLSHSTIFYFSFADYFRIRYIFSSVEDNFSSFNPVNFTVS